MDLEVWADYTFLQVTLVGMSHHSNRSKTEHLALGVGPTLTPEWSHLKTFNSSTATKTHFTPGPSCWSWRTVCEQRFFSGVNSLTCHLVPSGIWTSPGGWLGEIRWLGGWLGERKPVGPGSHWFSGEVFGSTKGKLARPAAGEFWICHFRSTIAVFVDRCPWKVK